MAEVRTVSVLGERPGRGYESEDVLQKAIWPKAFLLIAFVVKTKSNALRLWEVETQSVLWVETQHKCPSRAKIWHPIKTGRVAKSSEGTLTNREWLQEHWTVQINLWHNGLLMPVLIITFSQSHNGILTDTAWHLAATLSTLRIIKTLSTKTVTSW